MGQEKLTVAGTKPAGKWRTRKTWKEVNKDRPDAQEFKFGTNNLNQSLGQIERRLICPNQQTHFKFRWRRRFNIIFS